MDNRWKAAALFTGATLILSGCAGAANEQIDAEANIIMAITSDIGTLDPHMGTSNDLRLFKDFTYDRLLYLAEDSSMAPWLAKDWTATARSIDMTIRDDVTCSDGTKITPTVVAANFERILAEDSVSPIKGAEMPADMVVTADESAGTVHFETETDFPFLLERVGKTNIVCQGGLDDPKAFERQSFGSGPYVLEKVEAGVEYRLVRNEDYNTAPGGADPENDKRPAKVTLRIVANETTIANLLLSGDVNIGTIQGPDAERVSDAGVGAEMYRVPMGEVYFNQDSGRPGASFDFRRAIIESLNLDELGQVVTSNRGTPATSLVTLDPMTCPADTVTGNLPEFDPAAGAKQLDQLGWTVGSDGMRSMEGVPLTLKVIYATAWGQPMANGAEFLGTQLKDAGIAVDLQGVDTPGMSGFLWDSGDFDIVWRPFLTTNPAPFVGVLAGENPRNGGENFASVNNEEYNALAQQATVAEGEEKICALWNDAETELIKNLDAVPFYQGEVPIFVQGVKLDLWQRSVAGWSLRMP